MFKRIDHVEIVPADIERSIRFYSEILGFKLKQRIPMKAGPLLEVVYLTLGDTMLELLAASNPAPASTAPFAVGYRSMALEVDDMTATLAELKTRDIEPTWGPADL